MTPISVNRVICRKAVAPMARDVRFWALPISIAATSTATPIIGIAPSGIANVKANPRHEKAHTTAIAATSHQAAASPARFEFSSTTDHQRCITAQVPTLLEATRIAGVHAPGFGSSNNYATDRAARSNLKVLTIRKWNSVISKSLPPDIWERTP
jgi:hypothetical protein